MGHAEDLHSSTSVVNATAELAEPGPVPVATGSRRRTETLRDLGYRWAVVLLWGVLIGIFGVLRPDSFLTAANFQTIFNSQAALAVLSLSLIPTLIVGEFDLSIAANAGVTATLVGSLNVLHGWPIGLAVVVGLLLSLTIGLVNGLIVVRLGVNTIVVTLGMATFLDGVSVAVSGSQTVGGVSTHLTAFMTSKVLGLQVVFVVAIVVVAIVSYVLRQTSTGRRMLFIGQGGEVARLTGVRVVLLRLGAFVCGGLLCGLSGIMSLGAQGGVSPSLAETQLLPAFAAAFLGTVVLDPGRFNAWGTAIAIYFLASGFHEGAVSGT